ncbi:uncharacterized protein M421DRAFT_418372 [Didymella exigua CBS 183.55]|uniref:CHAT domain-containing protein n=1 Tax=Didymella exigua CBS 183.55 TaxID=1150837 RepID=A0A6A5RX76_9PLEO|nr:uncharacterized protein M421DRAFT_418372 [Didymella exigua CBS 183.55]KAF1930896.1 hypothetical protein M421DRAFT_418372 [Didymella exigua CBS 183.55]
MAKCSIHRPQVTKIATEASLDIPIVVKVDDSHIQDVYLNSPIRGPCDFRELWNAVRVKAGASKETTERSTRNLSLPSIDSIGECKPRAWTCEKEIETTTTNLRDVRTEKDSGSLDWCLTKQIVGSARDKAQVCIRRGDTVGACKAFEDALETLEQQFQRCGRNDPTPWLIARVEILIDQGQTREAREALSELPTHSQESTDAEQHDERLTQLGNIVEITLDLCRRTEDWARAHLTGRELFLLCPDYFKLDEQVDRSKQIRRILNTGMLQEIDANGNTNSATHLARALDIYNYGCHASEAYYSLSNTDKAIISDFDHPDCANIFFSAARVCHYLDRTGYAIMPRSFPTTGPQLTCVDWKHQALHFLERVRARALLDTIVRSVAEDESRRLASLSLVAYAARSLLVKRASVEGSLRSSSTPSLPVRVTSDHMPLSNGLEPASRRHSHALSDGLVRPDLSALHTSGGISATLQPSNLSDADSVSVPTSPAGTIAHALTKKEYAQLRIRRYWNISLLWALTKVRVSAALVNVPADTVVVEYALASTAPSGIMIVIAATDAVKSVVWKTTDTVAIQNCIRDLRSSMEAMDEQADPGRHSDFTTEQRVRPIGPKPNNSNFDQVRLRNLLHGAIVAPVQPYLKGKRKLIIVPSGDLAHVPWRIFFDLPITVVPSLGIWARLKYEANAKAVRHPKVSVVSTAPIDRDKKAKKMANYIRGIPFSRIEALYVARLHGETPFLADGQTHKDLQSRTEDTQILHICAHSNYDPAAPMSSSLQLFKEPLTVADWLGLSIKAELVVFSSCVSGISRAYDSGSTIGFAHTLLGTGTKAFIGSLWKVNDCATLLLMAMFYEQLKKPLPPVEALYKAQNRMRDLTDNDLQDTIDDLEHYGKLLRDAATTMFVINPDLHLFSLRNTKAGKWRDAKYWAGFVLTGYGSKNIYPMGSNADS